MFSLNKSKKLNYRFIKPTDLDDLSSLYACMRLDVY